MKDSRRTDRGDGKQRSTQKTFNEEFAAEIGYHKDGRVEWKKFHAGLLKYDPNSLIHGCFLEEIGGRLRATRALSGFLEASGIALAESGGVKNNIVQPELKGGEGNVPFHRTEFTAKQITAYFNLDLALLHGYGLPTNATHLLIALALFKIRRFLSTGLRLRTACDLQMLVEPRVTRPDGFRLPSEADLLADCKRLIAECNKDGLFTGVTELEWEPPKQRAEKGKEKEAVGPEELEEDVR
jgi:CRISPR-associated protein Csb1